ncbi:hypothetical protein NEISICOT_03678 [Neisseria sicca ATCC 29256]|uniref:Uncharacterized protein n=1 Tax=Neisseria sicca ATCC 29256 TaxID=547045 RepID=C6MAU6_NEISI|nr:hypothetical protein NEISICOT_03678 [Neisseria sicca ATCC 29256]
MMLLQTQCLIAFAFGFIKIEVQHAVAAPCVGIGQKVLQQAAGVAVAGQQQFGLLGVVRRDFGVEQPLAVAAAALSRFARFQNGNAHAVFRQLARGCGAGNARADNHRVFGRSGGLGSSEPRFDRLGRGLRYGFGLPFDRVEMFVQAVGAVWRDKPDMHVGQQAFQKVDAVELKAFYGLVEAGFQTTFQLGWGIGKRKIGNAVFGQAGNQMQRRGMSFDHAGKFGGGGRGVPSEDGHSGVV